MASARTPMVFLHVFPPKCQLVCPFPSCTDGKVVVLSPRGCSDMSIFRSHVSTHCVGFVPSSEWLASGESRMCPGCAQAVCAASRRRLLLLLGRSICRP